MKIFGIFFSAVTILWIFYVYLGQTAQTRVYRACYPVEVTSNTMTEITSRWDYNAAQTISTVGNKALGWCQYGIYRSIYGEYRSENESSIIH